MITRKFVASAGGAKYKQMSLLVFLAVTVAITLTTVFRTEPPSRRPGAADKRLVQYRGTSSFDLRNAIIPANEIRSGGVPKDGIPALTNPPSVAAKDAAYLKARDRVVGVVLGEESRAYPLKILAHHEIVNDRLGGIPIAVTYCPLCDSVVVFDRRTDSGQREFGVSGLLYNSNVLMYDRHGQPESLWSQVATQGVSGPGARTMLKTLPVELTTWQNWQTRHPDTTALSDQTGHGRNYRVNPYRAYFRSRNLMFPAKPMSNRLPAKSMVLGIWSDGKARAYPLAAFRAEVKGLEQELDGKRFTLAYDAKHKTLRVLSADEGVHWMYSFWFAWYAFRPHTDVYTPKR